MSMKHIVWAREQGGMNGGAKSVLYSLASRFGNDNSCFPGRETIAKDACISVTAVRVHLAWLEANGFIRREHRSRKNGSQGTTKYTFPAFDSQAESAPECADSQAESAPHLGGSQAESAPPESKDFLLNQSSSAKKKNHAMKEEPISAFALTGELEDWAAKTVPSVNVRSATESFIRFHQQRESTSIDWPASWRGWMQHPRTAEKHSKPIPKEQTWPPGWGSYQEWIENPGKLASWYDDPAFAEDNTKSNEATKGKAS